MPPTDTKAPSPVANALCAAESAVAQVNGQLDTLNGVLTPVLMPPMLAGSTGNSQSMPPAPPVCPLQARVDSLTASVLLLSARIGDVLQRAQV